MPDPADVRALKRAGYICIRLEPLLWRARSPYGYRDFWPVLRKHKPVGAIKPVLYIDPLEVVAGLPPWEEPRPYEEQCLIDEWRDGLKELYRKISTAGHLR